MTRGGCEQRRCVKRDVCDNGQQVGLHILLEDFLVVEVF